MADQAMVDVMQFVNKRLSEAADGKMSEADRALVASSLVAEVTAEVSAEVAAEASSEAAAEATNIGFGRR